MVHQQVDWARSQFPMGRAEQVRAHDLFPRTAAIFSITSRC